jgi:ParB/RepB/Spo0J family partition protein
VSHPAPTYRELDVAVLMPDPRNPRAKADPATLGELVASIKALGIVQPLVVRPLPAPQLGKFLVIAGHRRLAAAKKAGLKLVPAVVREATAGEAHLAQFAENHGREDLTPLEEAGHLKRVLEASKVTQEQLAKQIGVSPSVVSDALKLLELPKPVHALFEGEHALSAAHGRELARLVAHPKQLERAVKQVEERRFDSYRRVYRDLPAKELRLEVNNLLDQVKRRAKAAARRKKGGRPKPQRAVPDYEVQWQRERQEREALQKAANRIASGPFGAAHAARLQASPAFKVVSKWPRAMVRLLGKQLDVDWDLRTFAEAVVRLARGDGAVARVALFFLWRGQKSRIQGALLEKAKAQVKLEKAAAAKKAKAGKAPARKGGRK